MTGREKAKAVEDALVLRHAVLGGYTVCGLDPPPDAIMGTLESWDVTNCRACVEVSLKAGREIHPQSPLARAARRVGLG